MESDLSKAKAALAAGRKDEASVYAWNALVELQPGEGTELARIAMGLDDSRLLAELLRRGVEAAPPPEQAPAPRAKRRRLFGRIPYRALGLIIWGAFVLAGIVATFTSEPGEYFPTSRDAKAVSEPGPILTEYAGVWLVPVGEPSRVDLNRLAGDLSRRYRIPVGTLPDVPLPAWTIDGRGRRLYSQALIRLLQQTYIASGSAVFIGVTDYDMYDSSEDLNHEFSLRAAPAQAVVSTSPLGADLFSRLRGHSRYKRTRKLVARNIGFLYFHRGVADDPRSLLRPPMHDVSDIDKLREQL